MQIRHTPLSGGYCGGVPPLPIPNREVKPTCADGTAMQCGRVGRRLLSMKSLRFRKISEAFLFFFFPLILLFLADLFLFAGLFLAEYCFVTQISQMTQIFLLDYLVPQISRIYTDFLWFLAFFL